MKKGKPPAQFPYNVVVEKMEKPGEPERRGQIYFTREPRVFLTARSGQTQADFTEVGDNRQQSSTLPSTLSAADGRILQSALERCVISLRLPGGNRGPLTQSDVTVLGEPTKLEQVCLNILINAMQAIPKGGVIHIISTVLASDGGIPSVRLSFADQGIGVPPENMPRLFDPYFTTRSEGTGLGLAIADRIVTDHGGRLSVESVVEVGTTMTLTLPLTIHAAITQPERP